MVCIRISNKQALDRYLKRGVKKLPDLCLVLRVAYEANRKPRAEGKPLPPRYVIPSYLKENLDTVQNLLAQQGLEIDGPIKLRRIGGSN